MTEEMRIRMVGDAMMYLHSVAELYLTRTLKALCLSAIRQYDEGYGGAKHHHAYKGGLAVHVADVVRRCLQLCGEGVDREVVLVAAFLHDSAKLLEYRAPTGIVQVTEYAKTIGHVVGSAIAFVSATDDAEGEFYYDGPKKDAIVHCMLSHHGRKEWGSPVEPATIEAFILHSADMLSSREGQ